MYEKKIFFFDLYLFCCALTPPTNVEVWKWVATLPCVAVLSHRDLSKVGGLILPVAEKTHTSTTTAGFSNIELGMKTSGSIQAIY